MRLAKAVFTVLFVLLITVTVIGMIAAPLVVTLIAPGFHAAGGKFALTVDLTRMMFPYLLFVSLAALAMGILNTLGSFFVSGLSSVMLSIFMISGVYIFSRFFRVPLYG